MFNELLTYLTVSALFGHLDQYDIRLVHDHGLAGDITDEQELLLVDLFQPLVPVEYVGTF